MIIKKNPVTPGQRGMVVIRNKLKKYKKIKKLLIKKKSNSGRNNYGRITTRHKGGGFKKKYRLIDFKREKHYVEAKVKSIEYDPNRNAIIMLLLYKDGEYRYSLYIKKIKIGNILISGENVENNNGNFKMIKNIPSGSKICCIEKIPNKGAVFARSAGTYGILISKNNDKCLIKIGKKKIIVNTKCFATIGSIGNELHYLKKLGKAGVSRNKGIRPTVRGVAMNPVDHPHGGGEGKTSTKRHPVSYKGKLTKGFKTRK
ncbi:50S ribosomal protein L2 [Candidatus Vidania fulgoroideorum]